MRDIIEAVDALIEAGQSIESAVQAVAQEYDVPRNVVAEVWDSPTDLFDLYTDDDFAEQLSADLTMELG